MKKICLLILTLGFVFAEYEYSLQDYNPTSESYGLDVWDPIYSDYMTLHFFSSQGWAGWTSTFGQLSNFQDELIEITPQSLRIRKMELDINKRIALNKLNK